MKLQLARFTRTFLIAAALLVSSASAAFAQSYRGSIRGVVTDQQALAVAGAKVTAKNLSTGEIRETSTDDDGGYVLSELPAGEYQLRIEKTGFNPMEQNARVNVGADTNADYTLRVSTGIELIHVSEDLLPLMDNSTSTLSQIVERRLVEELPLNGRDFTKLVALTPGVTVESSGVAGTEKGFGQFNINGNRDRSNNYTLDGTDNNDPFFNNSALNQVGITGAPATLLPLDAIQEFNLQAQIPAEYGRNSGSVVNVISRSGTNTFHGSLYEFHRNSFFDARNFFNASSNPQSRFVNNNFGGSFGGPLKKDRTFFFFAYEGQRERVGSDFILVVPTAQDRANARAVALAQTFHPIDAINPALDAILDFFPASATNNLAASVRDSNDNNNFILKLDHRLAGKHSLSARYAFGQSDQIFPLGSLGGFGSGSRLPAFTQVSPTRVQVLSLSLLSTLSSTKLNEVRFGYSRFRTGFTSTDQTDPSTLGSSGIDFATGKLGLPEIDFNGDLDNLGTSAFSIPRGRVSESFQVLDNFTWIRGRHTVKFGGEYRRAVIHNFNDNLERGLMDVNSTIDDGEGNFVPLDPDPIVNALANFYIGNFFVLANTGDTQRVTFNNGLSFFAQDDIRLRPSFTLNLGLRWEYFGPLGEKKNLLTNLRGTDLVQLGTAGLDTIYERDLNNFSPRIGFAWSPRRNTVVRAGYGLYYDYIPQNLLIANFTTSAGLATNPTGGPGAVRQLNPFSSDFNPDAFNGNTAGPVFSFGTPPFSIFVTDPDLRTPYVSSWNLNLQQQLGSSFAAEIGYVGSKGTKLVRLYDLNQDFTFPNPDFGVIDVFSSGANSTYHALQTTVRLQNFHRFSGFSTYTWSKSLDGASDGIDFNFATAAFPQNSDNLPAEKGPSTFDTRHRWTTAINYQLPACARLPKRLGEGWQLNTIFTVQSGRPIGIITSDDTSGTFNFHQRPNVVPGVNPVLSNWSPDTGYLNPAAFSQPPFGTFGDLGRNQIFGPGYWNLDFSVSKNTKLRENLALQFRAEFFNLFNHPNFALPSNVVDPETPGSLAGVITQTPDVAQGNPGLGGGGPRVLQFALRFVF